MRIHNIRTALEDAETWGQFRTMMPADDYEDLAEQMRECRGEDDDPIGDDDEPFDSSDIPGYCDGDYPDWLQARAQEHLPRDLLEKYGDELTTTLNGNYWHIGEENAQVLLTALRWRKYDLTERADLRFYCGP